jgi:hypothetical protein
VRTVVLVIALLFMAMLGTLTALDIVRYGVSALDVISILILLLFATGIIGALRTPPRR